MTDTETGTRDEADIRGVVKERIAALRDRDAGRLAATEPGIYMDGSGRAANDLRPEASDA